MYKALISFCGKFSMTMGEVGEIPDPAVVKDLLKAGYIEEIKEDKEEKRGRKGAKSNEYNG